MDVYVYSNMYNINAWNMVKSKCNLWKGVLPVLHYPNQAYAFMCMNDLKNL